MAKKKESESVYRIIDVVGVSEESWEDAGRRAVETAASSLRDLRVAVKRAPAGHVEATVHVYSAVLSILPWMVSINLEYRTTV